MYPNCNVHTKNVLWTFYTEIVRRNKHRSSASGVQLGCSLMLFSLHRREGPFYIVKEHFNRMN